MTTQSLVETATISLFGEVLFDCFTDEQAKETKVLGGAPFNICWHLQALGDNPNFISRVGKDELGQQILKQSQAWGINVDNIQLDNKHSTGQVNVEVINNEPHYDIRENSAYDYIQADLVKLSEINKKGILYHGSLALRSDSAKQEFNELLNKGSWSLFLDVNLRAPWWQFHSLETWLRQARWVKLNIDELAELGFDINNLEAAMLKFQQTYQNEQVIVTLGADGVKVLSEGVFYSEKPQTIESFIDTVGAGDAFTAIYMHGLMHQWSIQQTLAMAQRFASKIIGIQGGTPKSQAFYNEFC